MSKTIDEIRKAKREYMAQKRRENPEASRAYQREYHHKNREKQCLKMREYYARRFFWGRSMKLRGENRASENDLKEIWDSQNGLCALTGRLLGKDAHLDHIIPKAKGGGDNKENLRWVCSTANLIKRDLTDEELFQICSDIICWIGERIQMFSETENRYE